MMFHSSTFIEGPVVKYNRVAYFEGQAKNNYIIIFLINLYWNIYNIIRENYTDDNKPLGKKNHSY